MASAPRSRGLFDEPHRRGVGPALAGVVLLRSAASPQVSDGSYWGDSPSDGPNHNDRILQLGNRPDLRAAANAMIVRMAGNGEREKLAAG